MMHDFNTSNVVRDQRDGVQVDETGLIISSVVDRREKRSCRAIKEMTCG